MVGIARAQLATGRSSRVTAEDLLAKLGVEDLERAVVRVLLTDARGQTIETACASLQFYATDLSKISRSVPRTLEAVVAVIARERLTVPPAFLPFLSDLLSPAIADPSSAAKRTLELERAKKAEARREADELAAANVIAAGLSELEREELEDRARMAAIAALERRGLRMDRTDTPKWTVAYDGECTRQFVKLVKERAARAPEAVTT